MQQRSRRFLLYSPEESFWTKVQKCPGISLCFLWIWFKVFPPFLGKKSLTRCFKIACYSSQVYPANDLVFLWVWQPCLITGIPPWGGAPWWRAPWWPYPVRPVMGAGGKSLVQDPEGPCFWFSSLELWYTGLSNSVVWYSENHLLQIMVEILKFANKVDQGQGHLHNKASLTLWLLWEVFGGKGNLYELWDHVVLVRIMCHMS